MISVIVPAHKEEAIIEPRLRALVAGADPGELEVIVVCNGCDDRTAERARAVGEPVRVVELPEPSKTGAINAGLGLAGGETVVVVDADIGIGVPDLRAMAEALDREGVLAASPVARMEYHDGTSWAVRAYYRFWRSLPYVKEGMIGTGVYAMNAAGRERLGEFPKIIADDGYFRMLFTSGERVDVEGAIARVAAPLSLADLIRIKSRSRLGGYELGSRFPELSRREAESRSYVRGMLAAVASPRGWRDVFPYLYVNLMSRRRAKRQMGNLDTYVWERDESSRRATGSEKPGGAGLGGGR